MCLYAINTYFISLVNFVLYVFASLFLDNKYHIIIFVTNGIVIFIDKNRRFKK